MELKDKKSLLIGGGIMTGVIVLAVGIGVYVLSGDAEPAGQPGFTNNTPTLLDAAQEPGKVSIEPMQISMIPGPDGSVQGVATVSALFQDFTAGEIDIEGDPRLIWNSDCLAPGKVLPAGERCSLTITYGNSFASAPADPSVTPKLIIMGNTRTPGGDVIPVEAEAIIGDVSTAAPLGIPVDGSDPTFAGGDPAPSGLDPYGPAPTNMPPVDYSQAPVPETLPRLSPREQFLLARRQAVFNGMRPSSTASGQPKPQGTWDDLNIPTATSSYPQDMTRVVTMDRIITAALVRPYDSRASQQVVAQVDRNVYGGHGRAILIPRGSKLVGTAQGGAERVAISWTQLIRPDGARFMIEASSGDAMGQAGVPGRVNQRLLKRYGSILLGTALNVGIAKATDAAETPAGGDFSSPARNNGAIISDIVRQDLEKITNDIVQRNQNVQPIVTVPAGTRITVIPTMDLRLRPIKRAEVQARAYPRAQNAGATPPRYDVNVTAGGDSSAPQEINFDSSSAPVTRDQVDLPPISPPATGSTPPWNSN